MLGDNQLVADAGDGLEHKGDKLHYDNGPRSYENYAGRNEALAIDVYDNLVRLARPRLAYFSASETAWFGVEHLSFGSHCRGSHRPWR